ncbi:hypothetical protein FNF28_07835 [Cafeteria roenbergensis]|uniref:DDE-1 domain-containing protein n=1 Tax=Cafeteria roenbergensis TaxID=33653 RepID=A0A5A8C0Q9_CAFRO|nr:hypothetical protein FNF28_07835 [Cafeteria roenbergensis]
MSVKHMPSLATVSQMHTDGTLHLFFASSNGWVTRSIFREAMHRWTAWEQIQDSDWEKRPKLLLMDGHAAHTDVASIKHLQDVGMRCAVPPGASSHMWQVLDNGPIGVFRKEFARIRLGAAAATLTGAVPCPATIIGLRQGVTSPKVFAELEVDSGEGKTSGIFVRLKDARKTKVHPSDTLCAGYHAWVAAATPAVLAGGFARTGTFAKGFTPDSKPTCDPEKILERMEAHRGGYDRDAIAAAVVERAVQLTSDKSVLTPEFTSRMKKELDIIRVATNYGFADDVDGPNRARRMALDLDNRQLVARTTDSLLTGNERYERHQRQLDVTDAHVNQIEAQARADHVLKSLRGLLEQAKRANAKARTTLKTISGTDVAQQASTSLAMIDSVLNTQAAPTKAALKRDLHLDSPAASLAMDKLRLAKQLVFVGLQITSAVSKSYVTQGLQSMDAFLERRESDKMREYKKSSATKDNLSSIVPFVVTTTGRMGSAAFAFLKKVADTAFVDRPRERARWAFRWLSRLNEVIAKGLATQLIGQAQYLRQQVERMR